MSIKIIIYANKQHISQRMSTLNLHSECHHNSNTIKQIQNLKHRYLGLLLSEPNIGNKYNIIILALLDDLGHRLESSRLCESSTSNPYSPISIK